MKRESRKKEHINHFLDTYKEENVFKDIFFVNNSLPEISFYDVTTKVNIKSINLPAPLIINAITGGSKEVYEINKNLAIIARELNIPLAVGSQRAAIENKEVVDSYRIVREIYSNGIIFGNVGANVPIEYMKKAVEMIDANGIQLHLNPMQELIMDEGDREFYGVLENICKAKRELDIPLIIKEVGFGISSKTASALWEAGVDIIDISGRGGTNFALIENQRRYNKLSEDLLNWGIPTPISILEVKGVSKGIDIIASGGINTGLDVAKAIALGASTCALAGPVLQRLSLSGVESAMDYLKSLIYELKIIMTGLGCLNLAGLRKTELIITGETQNWLTAKNYKFR